jgi:hypothetical protein
MTDQTQPASHSPRRRDLLVGGAAAPAAFGLAPAPAHAGSSRSLSAAPEAARTPNSRLHRWAADTWHSLDAMTDQSTGLPADNIPASLTAKGRSGYTSPTNIGGYLWSAIVARELGIITAADCAARLVRTLETLQGMEHHEPSGMYFNWYDPATGDALRTWPEDGKPVEPFVSSVDSGWLGAACTSGRTPQAPPQRPWRASC